MTRKIGIDLGSASLGWFIREEDTIINNGVVTFKTGMVKGQGGYSSPTKDRREARSKRNLIQARKYRKWELLKVLIDNNYVPLERKELERWSKYKKGEKRKFPETESFLKWLACDFTYQEKGIEYKSPYELRVKAIDEKLSKHEFGRALYHIVQRRGYKDIGESDNETKNQIERRGESGFKSAMESNRTIAEALSNEFLKKDKRARNEYPYREEYESEFVIVCKSQGLDVSKDENGNYLDRFVSALRKAIIWQRPLRSQKGNIGRCTLEPSRQRCPASHPIFEIFRTWSYINTIKYIDDNGEKQDIPYEYRNALFENVFLKRDANFKFDVIQKFLDRIFKKKKEYNYINKYTRKYDSSVSGMPVSKGMINIFGEELVEYLIELHKFDSDKETKVYKGYSISDLWHIMFEFDEEYLHNFAKNKLNIKDKIRKSKNGDFEYSSLVDLKKKFPAGYADLSVKAMRKIIPFLMDGFLYNEAVLLAKLPELIEDWDKRKQVVLDIVDTSKVEYQFQKTIATITNSLVDKYKGLTHGKDMFAYNDFEYQLSDSDLLDVENACKNHFGIKTWDSKDNKVEIIDKVGEEYQTFFYDSKRRYVNSPVFTELIKNNFEKEGVVINGELYHHSDKNNIYGTTVFDKSTGAEILSIPLIDSIKNPMFNKTMSVLRKLFNELILDGQINNDTEVIVEVARELNDNNKRAAIERYQKERRDRRQKYREFIQEFKTNNSQFSSLDIEGNIPVFEMWTEQTYESTVNESGDEIKNMASHEILKEKNAIKRYELWIEQKGQCMYTGKMIGITQLFSSDIEIEHTIPRSLLPDNTMANQTVCFSKYNSDIKNNRIPHDCPNYEKNGREGTAIAPRLDIWIEKREHYKALYKGRQKPKGTEDEDKKNKRIQEKHYFKMHFEYWKDKVERFTTDEIKDSWARRQLVDTQMVSKYAREFLKTYFKKVVVQKGSVTADFRKIYGFQAEDEIKNRNKHTHHSIDAAVLTLIPTNSTKRVSVLNKMYKKQEEGKKQHTTKPDGYPNFNAQKLIKFIDNNTLIVNYQKDKITEQTYRNVRKRGKLQKIEDENGNEIQLIARGTTVRGRLFQDTFVGKIKDVERDENGSPLRNEDKTWKYKQGKDEFIYTVRKPITDAKIEDIIDPDIRNIIEGQLKKGINISDFEDHRGKTIRHVRVRAKAGKKVKARLNYKSKHDYKNSYYAAAGEIPYAIFMSEYNGRNVERKLIPVPIHEVAQVYKDIHKFDIDYYLKKFHPNSKSFQYKKILKVGQKVFVLKNDEEYESRNEVEFQMNRLYKITQFKYDGSKVLLMHHLEAQSKSDIDVRVKGIKSDILFGVEKEFNISPIEEDFFIEDVVKRKKDFEKRVNDFSARLKKIKNLAGDDISEKYKTVIGKYKTESSSIVVERETPILGLSKANWNFLFEGYDFSINIVGELKWIDS